MIMSGNEAWNRNLLNADGRLTEMGLISRCPAGCFRWWVRRLGRPGRRRWTVLLDDTSRRLVRAELHYLNEMERGKVIIQEAQYAESTLFYTDKITMNFSVTFLLIFFTFSVFFLFLHLQSNERMSLY